MTRNDRPRCAFDSCYEYSEHSTGVPVCPSHARAIISKYDYLAKSKNGWQREQQPPQVCLWPKCGRDTDPESSKLCHVHADIVVSEVGKHKKRRAATERETQKAKSKAEPKGDPTIYYVQIGGHIKIGWTSDLASRMRDYPPNTTLMACHRGSRSEEKRLHDKFAHWRSHGREWYPLAPVILDHIQRMVDEHGAPKDTTFGARPVEPPRPRSSSKVYPKYWTARRDWALER